MTDAYLLLANSEAVPPDDAMASWCETTVAAVSELMPCCGLVHGWSISAMVLDPECYIPDDKGRLQVEVRVHGFVEGLG